MAELEPLRFDSENPEIPTADIAAKGAPTNCGEPEWLRSTQFGDRHLHRFRQTGIIEANGREHYIRMSHRSLLHEDDSDTSTPLIAHFPGWTEMIDAGMGMSLHDHLARRYPHADVLSIATDGVSKYGPAVSYDRAMHTDFVTMGQDRHAIIRHFANGSPVTITGMSMGAVIALQTARANLTAETDRKLDIHQIHLLSPGAIACNVPDEEQFRDRAYQAPSERLGMFGVFVGHVVVDGIREAARNPAKAARAAAGSLAVGRAFARQQDKATAVTGHLLQLMEGVEWEHLREAVGAYGNRIFVTTGSHDVIGEFEQWRRLGLDPTILQRRGHLMTIDPDLVLNAAEQKAGKPLVA